MGEEKKKKVFVGFKPYSHQRAVIEKITGEFTKMKTVVCKSSRQKGKSTMIANILLWYVFNQKGSLNISLSPTLQQARAIFKTICDAVADADVIKYSNQTLLEIQFKNGSRIMFKSAEMKQHLRGYTVTGILCIDEAAYIDDDVFYIVLPWIDAHQAPMLLCSTPFIKQGFFYRYYQLGFDEDFVNITSIDWNDEKYKEDIQKLLPPQRLEEYRKSIPKKQFLTEYLGEFLDGDGVVFDGFKDCVGKTDISNAESIYIGIDWGAGSGDNDYTVVCGIDESGNQVLLEYWNDLNTTKQIDRIVQILEPLGDRIQQITPENNSIGKPLTDLLCERSQKWNIERETTTNQSKVDMVSELQVAFENKSIVLMDDAKQLRELGTYEAQYNPKTKNVSYNAPYGMHDDTCIALMLAWHTKKHSFGNYAIRFHNNKRIRYR